MKVYIYKLFITILFTLPYLFVTGQVNKTGIPFFRNFSPKEYKAHNQNWAVVRDKRGIIYFGNNDNGVLEYDGKSWAKIPVPNNSIVRCLAVDSNNTVYVGAVGEFGKLQADASGKIVYKSLSSQLDTSKIKFSNIWKTYVNKKNEVYFCSNKYIFLYNQKSKIDTIGLADGCFWSFYIDGTLYIGNWKVGLLKLSGKKVELAKGGDYFIDKDILNILPYKRGQLIVYTYDGLIIYNTLDGTVSQPENNAQFEKTSNFLRDNIAYTGTCINDNLYAWGTINAGLAISEKKGKLIENYTDSTGVQSKTFSDIYYCNDQGVLWATLGNGISKFEFNSPFRYFSTESKLAGTVYDIIRYNGVLYIGTELGLYKLEYNKNGFPVFTTIPKFKGQSINSMKLMNIDGKEHLIIGTSWYLSEIFNNQVFNYTSTNKDTKDEYIQTLYVSKFNKNTVYLGEEKGLKIATYINGKFKIVQHEKITNEIRWLAEDNEGDLWACSLINGVYRLAKDGSVTNFTTNDGLPVMNDIFVTNTVNGIVFGTAHGFYIYDKKQNRFIPSDQFGNNLNKNKRKIISFFPGFNNQIWMNIDNRVYKFSKHYNEYKADTLPFRRLPQMTVQVIYSEPDGLTWIGGSEGLFCYDNLFKRKYNINYNTLIRSVIVNSDSTLFNGTNYNLFINGNDSSRIPCLIQPNELKPILAYKFNNLTFSFSAPYFEDENNIKYSYFLEGFSEKWSTWSTETKKEFTNLYEGKYIFRVKAQNIYAIESTIAEFEFEILPPWWRTTWAYVGYVVIGIFILLFSIKFYTRKLEADKKRLEGIVVERTAEIVKQKDEILDKNKEIELINKDITASIRYAKRIQEALLPTEGTINTPGLEFFIYFKPKDIVSGDFYFLKKIERSNILIAAAADCTGHGVPGAFMSMLGISFLNEIITKPEVTHSDDVLNHLRESIIESLNQSGREGETKDGMDINLIAYDYNTRKLEFSGANNPLYLVRNGELAEYKGDKMPIGLHDKMHIPFARTELDMQNGDVIYLFSDGFADQFGGDKGRKYMYKKFKEFLVEIYQKPMEEQRSILEKEALDWRGEMEQIDDHIVMGIKFNL
ncbi:MAG: SpoIIE family protein phosphatase [Bacteroidia bacterium]|nr:SpoIIE family protein phosphatase [Bacteroidia bacterium]